MPTTVFLLIVLISAFSVPAVADPLFDPPPLTDEENRLNALHRYMLRERRYAELDKHMNQIQQDYEQGKRSDVELLHLFRAFYDTDPNLERNFSDWIVAYPQSYAAREAEGIYFRRVGYGARGSDYISKTPPQQIARMRAYLDRSLASHKAALNFTAKPLLTYYDLLSLSKLLGDRALAEHTLRSACRIDPRNFIVRYKYMLMLETRWGGSLQEMVSFREDSKHAGLTNEQLGYLDELIGTERAWLAKRRSR